MSCLSQFFATSLSLVSTSSLECVLRMPWCIQCFRAFTKTRSSSRHLLHVTFQQLWVLFESLGMEKYGGNHHNIENLWRSCVCVCEGGLRGEGTCEVNHRASWPSRHSGGRLMVVPVWSPSVSPRLRQKVNKEYKWNIINLPCEVSCRSFRCSESVPSVECVKERFD